MDEEVQLEARARPIAVVICVVGLASIAVGVALVVAAHRPGGWGSVITGALFVVIGAVRWVKRRRG